MFLLSKLALLLVLSANPWLLARNLFPRYNATTTLAVAGACLVTLSVGGMVLLHLAGITIAAATLSALHFAIAIVLLLSTKVRSIPLFPPQTTFSAPLPGMILLFGVLGDKDYRTMAKRLFALADRVILTRPNSKRALPPEELRRAAAGFHRNIEVVENPGDALLHAFSLAGEEDLVCAAGSLYLVGEIKKLHQKVFT